jgi:integrase
MPIYKTNGKKDGKQCYRVRVAWTDNNGKHHQIERTAYGKEEARELETFLTIEAKKPINKKMTFDELCEEYKNSKKHEVRESTIRTHNTRIDYYILPYLKSYKIDKINQVILQNWKTSINESKSQKTGEPLSIYFKKSVYADLRAIFNYAVKMGYLPINPLKTVDNFRDAYEKKTEINYYTAEEFKKFIAEAKNCAKNETSSSIYEWNFYVFFNIAFYTGMRKGEIYALTWNDVSDNVIHITKSITQKIKGNDRVTPPKNKSSVRDVKIPKVLKNVLEEHLNRYKWIAGFTTEWYICGGEKCIRDTSVDKHNRKYAKAAGLKRIRIHDFRHSHASLLANSGINIQEVARRLGHSNVEITWNTYSHLYPQEEDRAIEILDNI